MNTWEITKKDLRLLTRDRRALATLVLLPLVFITILGLSTGQMIEMNSDDQSIPVAIVDEVDYVNVFVPEELVEDEGENEADSAADPDLSIEEELPSEDELNLLRKNARQLVRQLIDRLNVEDGLSIREVPRETAEGWIEETRRDVVVFIGPEFFKRVDRLRIFDFMSGEAESEDSVKFSGELEDFDISLRSRTAGSRTESTVERLVMARVIQTVGPYIACKNAFFRRGMKKRCAEYELEGKPAPIEPKIAAVGGKSKEMSTYQELVPMFTVMFVFFLVVIMARSFIQERELGTLRRLRIAPVNGPSLLAGKTIPFFIISLTQTLLLFLCGRLLFGMSWGPEPLLLLPVIACTSLAATGLGLMVATMVRTDAQVSAYANIVVITMAGISGCFMPRDWLPELMKKISLITPHAWALMAYKQLLAIDRPNHTQVFQSCAVLASFGLFFFVLGCLRTESLD